VSEGVANELKKRYGVSFEVIRNLPIKKQVLGIEYPAEEKTIIYQGALNLGRGLERLITAMQYISNCKLIIVGTGDLDYKLKLLSRGFSLDDRISFLGKIPLEQLHAITCKATLGVSLEEDLGLSYHYALPNKVFDYIQASLPVMVSDLPEMKSLVEQYSIGMVIDNKANAYALADQLKMMLNNKRQLQVWHKNTLTAAEELCWERESHKLVSLFTNI
jgi:glycosyltransferase involved in cell wall biosynthesis